MNVKELIEILQGLPADMEVMVPTESNVDRVVSIYVARVAKTKRDWSNTPVGNFHVFNDYDLGLCREETTGDPFSAVIIDLNPQFTSEFFTLYQKIVKAVDERFDVRGSDLATLVLSCLDNNGTIQNSTRMRLEERIPVDVFDFIEQYARETAPPLDATDGG